MTLPTGAIAMSDVNTELGQGSTTTISLNDTNVRNIAGIPSGAISMNDLRGKSASTYGTLSPNLTTIAEGGSVTFTLSGGTGIPNGTYYWRVDYLTNIDSADFVSVSGSFSITNNTGSFAVTTVNDTILEGNGTFRAVIGVSSGVPVVAVASSTVTVTETTTFTASANITSVYRYGSILPADNQRTVTHRLDMTQVPVGTTIYTKIVSVSGVISFSGTNNSGDIENAQTGSFSTQGTTASGYFTHTVITTQYDNGATVASKSYRVEYYLDAGLTNLIATGPTITIRAAPTYSLSFSPTSINEGSKTTGTITTTNLPPSTTLYYTSSGTAGATTDFTGFPASGSIVLANNSATFSLTAIYDSLTESAETFTLSLRTVSTTGTVVATATITVNQYLGVITTLTASKTGGATAGSSVSVYLQIASIAAYPLSRTFNITYSLNSAAYTSASLVTTTITVAANATSSSNTLVYSNASASTTCTSLVFKADCTGHTTKTSNTLSGGYV